MVRKRNQSCYGSSNHGFANSPFRIAVVIKFNAVQNYRRNNSFFGAGYLIHLGFENLRAEINTFKTDKTEKGALKRGAITNFLSPNPYLFWLSIGGPIVFESLNVNISATVLFILGFYTVLIESKIVITLIVDKSKSIIKSKYYLYILRALGIILILFALIFFKNALRLMGFI
ncbi:MAG: LysE family transporter [Candidatus Bathyarchaeia archaeon]|nr:LysE family transporter [Candidatus Bathyarchaeia archaeon]